MPTTYRKPLPPLKQSDYERFWKYVDQRGADECWPWRGACQGKYGCFTVWTDGAMRTYRSHRIAYLIGHGQDPGPSLVCHSCDSPPCCNPAHLFLGTVVDNARDMIAKGRNRPPFGDSHCMSKLTSAQVVEIKRRIAADEMYSAIAADYEVSKSAIQNIANGYAWKRVPGPSRSCFGHERNRPRGDRHYEAKLTVSQVQEIKRMRAAGVGRNLIAKQFGVAVSSIWSIDVGKNWKHVT